MSEQIPQLTNSLLKITASAAYGWYAKRCYENHFDICWRRKASEPEKVHADWKRIFRKKPRSREPIYISAGDLFLMGPLLLSIADEPEYRDLISEIRIKRIPESTFKWLSSGPNAHPSLLSKELEDMLEINIQLLKNKFGTERVRVEDWEGFPPFHGSLYRGYVHFALWAVEGGSFTHRTDGVFMKREKDERAFAKMEKLIHAGFE